MQRVCRWRGTRSECKECAGEGGLYTKTLQETMKITALPSQSPHWEGIMQHFSELTALSIGWHYPILTGEVRKLCLVAQQSNEGPQLLVMAPVGKKKKKITGMKRAKGHWHVISTSENSGKGHWEPCVSLNIGNVWWLSRTQTCERWYFQGRIH